MPTDYKVDQLTAATRADLAYADALIYMAAHSAASVFVDRKLTNGLLMQLARGVDPNVGVACINTWRAVNNGVPANVQATTMAYSPELGIMVSLGASGGTGTAMWSADGGVTWNLGSVPDTAQNVAVCWAGGTIQKFVAVRRSGTGNRVLTSTDGKTWATQTSTNDSDWRSVAYSPQLDLVVMCALTASTSTSIATSPDGVNWTARTAAVALAICAVSWLAEYGRFVAMCASVAGSLTTQFSVDGINWTSQTAYTGTVAKGDRAMAWAPEINTLVYVANTTTTSCIWSSGDGGATFTIRTAPISTAPVAINWSPEFGVFLVITAAAPTTGYYSKDGITWVSVTTFGGVMGNGVSILWNPDALAFCIGGSSAPGHATSLPAPMAAATVLLNVGVINAAIAQIGQLALPSAAASGLQPPGPAAGVATLVGGTVTVTTKLPSATTKIFYSMVTPGGVVGTSYTLTQTNGTSFTLTSQNALDTSTINWMIIETFTPA